MEIKSNKSTPNAEQSSAMLSPGASLAPPKTERGSLCDVEPGQPNPGAWPRSKQDRARFAKGANGRFLLRNRTTPLGKDFPKLRSPLPRARQARKRQAPRTGRKERWRSGLLRSLQNLVWPSLVGVWLLGRRLPCELRSQPGWLMIQRAG